MKNGYKVGGSASGVVRNINPKLLKKRFAKRIGAIAGTIIIVSGLGACVANSKGLDKFEGNSIPSSAEGNYIGNVNEISRETVLSQGTNIDNYIRTIIYANDTASEHYESSLDNQLFTTDNPGLKFKNTDSWKTEYAVLQSVQNSDERIAGYVNFVNAISSEDLIIPGYNENINYEEVLSQLQLQGSISQYEIMEILNSYNIQEKGPRL